MTEFTMKLADVVIKAGVNYESTKEFCSGYLCGGPAELELSVSADDILRERRTSEQTESAVNYSDAYLERLALYRRIVDALTPYGVILFHGSAVEADNGAYVFTAPSGTGKSTHARLWREVYGERAKIINDDKPLIRFTEGVPVIFGTPWCGKHGLERNVCVPVKAICLLNRGEENSIVPIGALEAFPTIVQQTYLPAGAELAGKTVELASLLVGSVSCWRMYCNMDPSAARMSFRAMVEGKTDEC